MTKIRRKASLMTILKKISTVSLIPSQIAQIAQIAKISQIAQLARNLLMKKNEVQAEAKIIGYVNINVK